MKRNYAVPLEERQRVYEEAEAHMGAVAVRWLDARVLGPVDAGLERELEEARRRVRRAQDRLADTERRLEKRSEE